MFWHSKTEFFFLSQSSLIISQTNFKLLKSLEIVPLRSIIEYHFGLKTLIYQFLSSTIQAYSFFLTHG